MRITQEELKNYTDNAGNVTFPGNTIFQGNLDVQGDLDVKGYLYVQGDFKRVLNIATTNCILVYNLYQICAIDTHLKIGCELHTYKEWAKFSDREIIGMSNKDSLKWFRKNQKWLMAFEK